jgi:hypothetical protein
MHPDELAPRVEKYAEAVARWQTLALAAEEVGHGRPTSPDWSRVVEATALLERGASREEVLPWQRANVGSHYLDDDEEWRRYVAFIENGRAGPIDARSNLVYVLELATGEIHEAIGVLEDLLGVGGEEAEWFREVSRRCERERPIEEEASRLMRRWESRNPEPVAPEPWNFDDAGYRASYARWWRWTLRHNQVYAAARLRAVKEMRSPQPARRPARGGGRGGRSRRCRSPRQARAPARPPEGDEPPDVAGGAA